MFQPLVLPLTHPLLIQYFSRYLRKQAVCLVYGLKENTKISQIQSFPFTFYSIATAIGSFGRFIRFNDKFGLLLIIQPSGVRRLVDTFSTCSLIRFSKPLISLFKTNKAGHGFKYYKQPSVRGIAKNPIDHPHGGRNKSIKIKRSPWGWIC